MRGKHDAADVAAADTLRGALESILIRGAWWTPSQLQHRVCEITGDIYSDGSITRRLREFREAKHGGYTVEVQRMLGGRERQYRFREEGGP